MLWTERSGNIHRVEARVGSLNSHARTLQVERSRHLGAEAAPKTQRAYVWPARHFASQSTDLTLPPMGLRVRLRADLHYSDHRHQHSDKPEPSRECVGPTDRCPCNRGERHGPTESDDFGRDTV